jgi:uncharacterized tellurite resistance protein B-like protein
MPGSVGFSQDGSMFQAFKDFVAELTGGNKDPSRFEDGDYRLSAAALLVHVGMIDGTLSDAERAKLHTIVKRCFNLDDAAADDLIAKATAAEQDAVDLYHFTSLLNRTLDEAGRHRMVEMMWQMVYADQQVTEFEDNLIWRAADLLGVSSRDRIELRRRVAGGQEIDQEISRARSQQSGEET